MHFLSALERCMKIHENDDFDGGVSILAGGSADHENRFTGHDIKSNIEGFLKRGASKRHLEEKRTRRPLQQNEH